jgi:hypothetical protein
MPYSLLSRFSPSPRCSPVDSRLQQAARVPHQRKVLPQRGMAFALSVEVGGRRSPPFAPIIVPLPEAINPCKAAGNIAQGAGIKRLWGRRSAALAELQWLSTAATGHDLPSPAARLDARRRQLGVHGRHPWALRRPQKLPLCREKWPAVQEPTPSGADMSSSGSLNK